MARTTIEGLDIDLDGVRERMGAVDKLGDPREQTRLGDAYDDALAVAAIESAADVEDLFEVIGRLSDALDRERAKTAGGEWRVEYGHETVEVGWVGEQRGYNYATSQRDVWVGPPRPLAAAKDSTDA